MNCAVVQRRLLANSHRLPNEVRAHLAYCGACRAWRRRLVRLERNVPLLPVPPSRRKAKFLREWVPASTEPNRAPSSASSMEAESPIAVRPVRFPASVRLLSRVAACLAALLLLVLFCTRQGSLGQSEDLQTARELRRNVQDIAVTSSTTPRERVTLLAEMADVLTGDLAPLARRASGDELITLAKLYEELVRDGILPQARQLQKNERHEVLASIVEQLSKTARLAEQLATEVPPEYAQPLLAIVAVARDVGRELTALLVKPA